MVARGKRSDVAPDAQGEVDIVGGIDGLVDEWDGLVDRLRGNPFQRPGWLAPWWDAFGEGKLEVLVARRHGRVVGLVPIARHGGRLRSATNWHSVSSVLVAEDEAATRGLVQALCDRASRSVALALLDPELPDLAVCLSAAAGAGYGTLVRPYQRSPYLDVDGDWERFEQSLSKNVRSDVRRRRRRLEDTGQVTIEVSDGRERLADLLEEGFRIEGSGWKEKRGSAIASQPETLRFYTAVARWAAERGWLRLAFLRLDDRPLAFHYNLEADGVVYHLKGGFDPAFERFSPGKVLHHAMLERAFTGGVARYEFLGEEDQYKLQWAGATRELVLFQAFSPSPLGRIDWLACRYGRPLAKRVLALARRGRHAG